MNGKEIKALVAELSIQNKETDRQLRETRKLVECISQDLGRLGNRLGEFVEEMVEPAAVALFQGARAKSAAHDARPHLPR